MESKGWIMGLALLAVVLGPALSQVDTWLWAMCESDSAPLSAVDYDVRPALCHELGEFQRQHGGD